MPWAFCAALLIALVIEIVAYSNLEKTLVEKTLYNPGQVPEVGMTVVQSKIESILQEEDDSHVELLVFGDSSGLMGVESAILEKETQQRTYNLCTTGFLGIEGNLFLLKHYIKKHGVPSVVLFHSAPETWGYSEEQFQQWGWLQLLKQYLENPDEKLNRTYQKLPSQNFRYLAQTAIFPESFTKRFLDSPRGRFQSHNDLLKSLTERKGSMDEVIEQIDLNHQSKFEGGVSATQLRAFRQLIKFSKQQGFQLCVVCNPIPELYRTPRREKFISEMEQTIISQTEGHENHVVVYQPLMQFVPNEWSVSLNHLSPNYKREYTRKLAHWIKKLAD